jgi:hypothetical protein
MTERYIHSGSFRNPVGLRQYEDGRHRCDSALKKIFAAGPQRPSDLLLKRDQSDVALNAALAKKLSRQERLRRSNAAEALAKIQTIHGKGPRRSLEEAQGAEPFISKSVHAVKKAQKRALHVGDNRMLSVNELNKAFAERPRAPTRDASDRHLTRDEILSKRAKALSGDDWNRMTWQERRDYFQKGLSGPALNDIGTKPPQSSNGMWNGGIADTGAANSWRDQPLPSTRPTLVGAQTTTTPSQLTRDAAVDAIKRALAKPQEALGNTADLDEDDEDMDDDDDSAKDPNRADAFE